MRNGIIALAVISALLGSTAVSSYGDTVYGVGDFNGFDALSGICVLDTDALTARMLILTPGLRWYGAADGLTPDTFYAIAEPAGSPDARSELFEINTSNWSVNSLGLLPSAPGFGPVREIAMDKTTGTLYGTDYANLYTITTTAGPGFGADMIGTFGLQPGSTEIVDYVFAMDANPTTGQLVGTSWRRGAETSDLYTFNGAGAATPGAGTRIGETNIDRFGDIWHSQNSGKLLGAAGDGQILEINVTNGDTTLIGTVPEVRFYGLANATPQAGTSEPNAFVNAPLTNLGYKTQVYADAETRVDVPGGGNPPVGEGRGDPLTDYNFDSSSTVDFDVLATVQDPLSPAVPWQNTNSFVTIDLSDSPGVPEGMLRVSGDMVVVASGSDEGVSGVVRDSAILGAAQIIGTFRVEAPEGWDTGMPAMLGVGVYTWGSEIRPNWDLIIQSIDGPPVSEAFSHNDDPWTFSIDVRTGQALVYNFTYTGDMIPQADGTFDLFADLDFQAAVQVPEPTTMLLLGAGAASLVARRRRRRN